MSNDNQLTTENKLAALDTDLEDVVKEQETNEDTELLQDVVSDDTTDEEVVSTDDADNNETEDEEDDEEEINPNDIELQVPVKMKELLAKYPNIKKDFPELIAANFREKEYAEIFPTPDDAKEAVEKVATLDKFQQLIFSGDSAPILDIVKKEDPAGFDKLVNNYLPNLNKVDPAAYNYIVRDTVGKYLNLAFSVGKTRNDQDLQTAAQMLFNLEFGNGQVPTHFGNTKADVPELDEIKKERAALETDKHQSYIGSLDTRIANSIKSNIAINIDPKKNMTDYVRKNAVNDCYNLIETQMKEDKRFQATIKGLEDKAKKNKYDEGSLSEIRKLKLGRAKYLMKEAINKIRTEALKGISTRDKNENAPRRIKVQDTKPDNQNGKAGVLNRKGKSTFDLLSEA